MCIGYDEVAIATVAEAEGLIDSEAEGVIDSEAEGVIDSKGVIDSGGEGSKHPGS